MESSRQVLVERYRGDVRSVGWGALVLLWNPNASAILLVKSARYSYRS